MDKEFNKGPRRKIAGEELFIYLSYSQNSTGIQTFPHFKAHQNSTFIHF